MAKKEVISDFRALKGKLSFSDDGRIDGSAGASACGSVSKGHDSASGCSKGANDMSDRVLKVGQKVVLMDSDLRGTIVSLGKTVEIELEDGLTIRASYGEFALTDEREISALKKTRVKMKATGISRASTPLSASASLRVDLHIEAIPGGRTVPKGQQLQFQLDTFRRTIRENLSHRGRTITFIHGIGDGILKAAIRKELDEVFALRCTYAIGDPAITVVTIR